MEREQVSPDNFDRKRRRLVRNRAFTRTGSDNFLNQIMAEEILERLLLVKRQFYRCLIIGSAPDNLSQSLEKQNIDVFAVNCSAPLVECDEDRLPFADHCFDLVICIGALDTVNDLPGSLILIKRILKPDGLFLAAFPGAESLPVLKALMMEVEGDRVTAHIHPQIDVRTMGDLMMRAGYALPVIDNETLQLRYSRFQDVIRDIRDYGGSNVLLRSVNPISRRFYDAMMNDFFAQTDTDSKITETIEILYLCGWAPHPDQPKPARRGSGQLSLKATLETDEGNG